MTTDTLEVMIFDDGSDVTLNFYGKKMCFSPEQQLMKSLLELAIQDASKPRRIGGQYPDRIADRIRQDALDFIASNDEEYPLSFVNCCEGLGLSPSAVRKRISGWQKIRLKWKPANPPIRGYCPPKLTEEQRITIRERLARGEMGIDLAKEFDVSRAAISKIKNRYVGVSVAEGETAA